MHILVIKTLTYNAGDVEDAGSIAVSGIPPEEGNGYPFQYSCLLNSMDKGAWQAELDTTE